MGNNNKKIGVLMGGPSEEREISLQSGRAVSKVLKQKGGNVKEIIIPELKEVEELKQRLITLIKNSGIDIAFLALHGWFGEDGTIQKLLEKLEMPYTGSGPIGCRNALDKKISRKIFKSNNVPIPNFKIIESSENVDITWDILPTTEFPVVVKPSAQGSSIGLNIVKTFQELEKALQEAFEYGDVVLIEEYLEGQELTVGIVGNRVLPVVEIVPKEEFYNFKAKYEDKGTDYIIPARISKELQSYLYELSFRAYKSLGCEGFGRVDIKLDERNKPRVLEVNTIPGLTSTSLLPKAAKADEIAFYQLCKRIIKNSRNSFMKSGE